MSTNKVNNQLFTELFRPKTLEQAVIVPRIYQELSKGVKNSILFYGKCGSGKTSLTRILASEYDDVLEINASLERGIDTIREQIISFASSSSLFDDGSKKMKIIILEEVDGLTLESQASLRAVLERYTSVRFIANCNYIEKLQEPLLSRFNVIPIEPINKEEEEYLFNAYIERIKYILNYLKISFTEESVNTFVKNDFPDMRSLVKKIQQLYTRGAYELTPDMLSASFDCSDLFNMILGAPNPWDNYKFLISEWSNKPEDAILQIGENFPEYIHTINPQKDIKIPNVIVTIAEHQHMLTTAIDKFIVLESLVFKLQMIMNS